MVEELDGLSTEVLELACDQAVDWLAKSESLDLMLRVVAASKKIRARARGDLNADPPTERLLNICNFQEEVLKFEGSLIRRALTEANGSVTRAAALLSMSYQALAYIIGGRHKDLLKERSPVRHRRGRKKDGQTQLIACD
jgi:transcriptional regulator with GAF, ATPase, and Fis domain